MTWLARGGLGIAVLAALATGRVVTETWPAADSDDRSFVREGSVGDTVRLRFADLTVEGVRPAKVVDTALGERKTSATWLVLDVTVVPRGEPLTTVSFLVEDGKGRVYKPDSRSGYLWTEAPTGVPWRARIPVEISAEALAGASLTLALGEIDQRRDDVARIDLGIDEAQAERFAESDETVEVEAAGPVAR